MLGDWAREADWRRDVCFALSRSRVASNGAKPAGQRTPQGKVEGLPSEVVAAPPGQPLMSPAARGSNGRIAWSLPGPDGGIMQA